MAERPVKSLKECQADAVLLADIAEDACRLDNEGHKFPALLEIIRRTAMSLSDDLEPLERAA